MPKAPKIPDQLKLTSRGFESHAVGRYAITCSVLIATFRMMFSMLRTLVFALLMMLGHTVVQAAWLL
ncbi:hypothetical protein PYH37_004971 [Sinorhizobium numidicum]|uniref:Transposase n=1 Tax=Sinorhizobium numidicum TaxID=680248 RepID=A0ABY8D0V9_9HYPH|nr:hypothetical protein [Sinorhizobium numidicum]WEX76651.1 hypothetical protein PYH37_004971 [Sinorhizobium numidicum]WEX83312.1 hypothetical protein PYH38_005683 [Sinorhizobium numidicum]